MDENITVEQFLEQQLQTLTVRPFHVAVFEK
jgi:hypothetical protein